MARQLRCALVRKKSATVAMARRMESASQSRRCGTILLVGASGGARECPVVEREIFSLTGVAPCRAIEGAEQVEALGMSKQATVILSLMPGEELRLRV